MKPTLYLEMPNCPVEVLEVKVVVSEPSALLRKRCSQRRIIGQDVGIGLHWAHVELKGPGLPFAGLSVVVVAAGCARGGDSTVFCSWAALTSHVQHQRLGSRSWEGSEQLAG